MKSITPREAQAVWDSLKNPSARSVARAMTQAGRRVHHSTIARWYAQGWRRWHIDHIRSRLPVRHSMSRSAC
jgi:hypothetical protein